MNLLSPLLRRAILNLRTLPRRDSAKFAGPLPRLHLPDSVPLREEARARFKRAAGFFEHFLLAGGGTYDRAYAELRAALLEVWEDEARGPTARQLVNRLYCLSAFADAFAVDYVLRERLIRSLYVEARALRDAPDESNALALLAAGLAFAGDEAQDWMLTALETLEATPPNPYALSERIEAAWWLEQYDYEVPDWLCAHIAESARQMAALRVPGGRGDLPDLGAERFPMLGRAATPDDVLAAAAILLDEGRAGDAGLFAWLFFGSEGAAALDAMSEAEPPDGSRLLPGAAVIREAETYLIFKTGPIPGGHADSGSVVLYVDGCPLLIDSGDNAAKPAPWREMFGSAAAHNTVEVAGEAGHGRVERPTWIETGFGTVLRASHLHAHPEGDVLHRRTLVWIPGRGALILDDLTGDWPFLAVGRWHLPHDLQWVRVRRHYEARDDKGNCNLMARPFEIDAASIDTGWQAAPNPVRTSVFAVETRSEGNGVPLRFGMTLSWGERAAPPRARTISQSRIVFAWEDEEFLLIAPQSGPLRLLRE
jgi:hypothetical protein